MNMNYHMNLSNRKNPHNYKRINNKMPRQRFFQMSPIMNCSLLISKDLNKRKTIYLFLPRTVILNSNSFFKMNKIHYNSQRNRNKFY